MEFKQVTKEEFHSFLSEREKTEKIFSQVVGFSTPRVEMVYAGSTKSFSFVIARIWLKEEMKGWGNNGVIEPDEYEILV